MLIILKSGFGSCSKVLYGSRIWYTPYIGGCLECGVFVEFMPNGIDGRFFCGYARVVCCDHRCSSVFMILEEIVNVISDV